MRDMQLLWKCYEFIEANPELWQQEAWAQFSDDYLPDMPQLREMPDVSSYESDAWGLWADSRVAPGNLCGTAFCIAGHAIDFTHDALFLVQDDGQADCFYDFADGGFKGIGTTAQKVLGLSGLDADRLFDGGNTLSEIYDMLTKWDAEEAQV